MDKKNHPMYGKSHSIESIEKMRQTALRRPVNIDSVNAMADSCRGTKFYNNGSISRRYSPDEVPVGWVSGRLDTSFNKNRGPMSESAKSKMSAAKRGKVPTINTRTAVCPHCGKEGQEANMKRWHFDKCKHKAKDDG